MSFKYASCTKLVGWIVTFASGRSLDSNAAAIERSSSYTASNNCDFAAASPRDADSKTLVMSAGTLATPTL